MTLQPTIQPHRLAWQIIRDDEDVDVVWYTPATATVPSITVDQYGNGWRAFYGTGIDAGPPHATLEDAIADAERTIFVDAYNRVVALGGWDLVANTVEILERTGKSRQQ